MTAGVRGEVSMTTLRAPCEMYLAFDRLEALAIRMGHPERFTRLCRRRIDENA